MIESTLHSRLEATVSPLVGGGGGSFSSAFSTDFDTFTATDGNSRIYPVLPLNPTALPLIIYQVTDSDSIWTLSGPIGIYSYSVAIDIFSGKLYAECEAIANQVRSALDGWTDSTVIVSTITGMGVEAIDIGFQYRVECQITARV